jgi:hypothetical protein
VQISGENRINNLPGHAKAGDNIQNYHDKQNPGADSI